MAQKRKKVLVYGCFDSIDVEDIKFFEEASKLGDLYVLKKKTNEAQSDEELLYMIQSIKYVYKDAKFSVGHDISIESDLYVNDVNDVNNNKFNINELIPWRLCISGGWLDQPWVSSIFGGSVIVMNVQYHNSFKCRGGLATSSRKTAIKLWENGILPQKLDNIEIAKLLFGAENPPGTRYISGSQDHLGLLLPGINRLDYNGQYWPNNIVQLTDHENINDINDIYQFIEKVLWLVFIGVKAKCFDPISVQNLSKSNVEKLAKSSLKVWNAILNCDVKNFGIGLTETLKATSVLFPNTVPNELKPILQKYDQENYGCSFTGSGGGGFLMVIADKKPDKNAFQIKINDKDWWRTVCTARRRYDQDDEEKRNEKHHTNNHHNCNNNICNLI